MGQAKIVNAGVDMLVLNAFYLDERGKPIKCELDPSLRSQLDEWKRAAQEAHEECPTPLLFNGAACLSLPWQPVCEKVSYSVCIGKMFTWTRDISK